MDALDKSCKCDIEMLKQIVEFGSISNQNELIVLQLYWTFVEHQHCLCLKQLFHKIIEDSIVSSVEKVIVVRLQYEYSKPKLKCLIIELLMERYSHTHYAHMVHNYQLAKESGLLVPTVSTNWSTKRSDSNIISSSPVRITINGCVAAQSALRIVNINSEKYNPEHRTVLRINDCSQSNVLVEHTFDEDEDNDLVDENPQVNRLLKHANPLNQNFLARITPGEDNNGDVSRSSMKSRSQTKWNSEEDLNNVETKMSRIKSTESSISTLLGSLRNKKQDKPSSNNVKSTAPVKFRTISNIGHRSVKHNSVCKSNSANPTSNKARYKSLEKAPSKRTSQPKPTNTNGNASSNSTWDSLYDMLLTNNPLSKLTMFKFKSNRNKVSSSHTEQKSSSEPNLSWKRSKITRTQSNSISNVSQCETETVGTPSQLYRISTVVNKQNPVDKAKCSEYSKQWTGSLDKKQPKPKLWTGERGEKNFNDNSWCDMHETKKGLSFVFTI